MMGLGALVVFAPIVVGVWVIALLGSVLPAAGLVEIVQVLRDNDRTEGFTHYLALRLPLTRQDRVVTCLP